MDTPLTVLFYGPSGAGKGTQAQLLGEFLRVKDGERETEYIETGALVRQFMQQNMYTAGLVRQVVGAGKLLPSFVPIYLWTRYCIEELEGSEHLLLDGLARRAHEVETLHEALAFYGRSNYRVISFKLSEASARERLRSRHRGDDLNEEAIERKMIWYREEVLPAIEQFRALGAPVHTIDAEPPIADIHPVVLKELGLSA